MSTGHLVITTMIAILTLNIALWASTLSYNQHKQTALLQTIAANTRPPVSIQVSGFSPEAQEVFNAAVKPNAKRGK